MALNLQQIRDYVRTHMDLDDEDLPDVVLDVFIREGSKRIERADSRWPFYEATWSFNTAPGDPSYVIPIIDPTIDQLTNVQGPKWNLQWVGREQYDLLNPPDTQVQAEPRHFTLWNDELLLNPTPDAIYLLTLRGYRKPEDWIAAGAGSTPDMPDDLHNCVATWALSRAYAQQEDPELAGIFERQFGEELLAFRSRIVETPHPQPIVLNGQRSWPMSFPGRLRFPFET